MNSESNSKATFSCQCLIMERNNSVSFILLTLISFCASIVNYFIHVKIIKFNWILIFNSTLATAINCGSKIWHVAYI